MAPASTYCNIQTVNRTVYLTHDSILCNFLQQIHVLTAPVCKLCFFSMYVNTTEK